MNKVVVLINIKSSNILIPKSSLFEANQSGLFNDFVINIIPLEHIYFKTYDNDSRIVSRHSSSMFIESNSYIIGYKGISYDDLVRATTRITQRFDDPRFFSLIYLTLNNVLGVSDELLSIVCASSNFLHDLLDFMPFMLFKNIY